MKAKAIFLDKDGTLVENIPYNVDPQKMVFYEDVPQALQLFQDNGYKLIVITNQPGIALGYFNEESLLRLRVELENQFKRMSVDLAGFYYCPHYQKGLVSPYNVVCECRKPKPGLLFKASEDLQIDLKQSWMVGDILNDVEAGNRSGCKSALIDNGNETEWLSGDFREPAIKVNTILEAAKMICYHENSDVKGNELKAYDGKDR